MSKCSKRHKGRNSEILVLPSNAPSALLNFEFRSFDIRVFVTIDRMTISTSHHLVRGTLVSIRDFIR